MVSHLGSGLWCLQQGVRSNVLLGFAAYSFNSVVLTRHLPLLSLSGVMAHFQRELSLSRHCAKLFICSTSLVLMNTP